MICLNKNEQGPELLAGYLAKTLDAARASEIDRHILECADCRGLTAVWKRLDAFEVPEVTPGFDARLYARIAQEDARASRGWRRWLWPPVAPAAAAVALAALVLFIRPPGQPDITTQVNTAEIEQVAQAVDDLDLLLPLDR